MPSDFMKGFNNTFGRSFQEGMQSGSRGYLFGQQLKEEREKEKRQREQELEDYKRRKQDTKDLYDYQQSVQHYYKQLEANQKFEDQNVKNAQLKNTIDNVYKGTPSLFSDPSHVNALKGLVDSGFGDDAANVLSKVLERGNDYDLAQLKSEIGNKARTGGIETLNPAEKQIFFSTFSWKPSSKAEQSEAGLPTATTLDERKNLWWYIDDLRNDPSRKDEWNQFKTQYPDAMGFYARNMKWKEEPLNKAFEAGVRRSGSIMGSTESPEALAKYGKDLVENVYGAEEVNQTEGKYGSRVISQVKNLMNAERNGDTVEWDDFKNYWHLSDEELQTLRSMY